VLFIVLFAATSADPHIRFLPVAYYSALHEKTLFGH